MHRIGESDVSLVELGKLGREGFYPIRCSNHQEREDPSKEQLTWNVVLHSMAV